MADYPTNEPITFVVEWRNGGIESPSIIYDLLPERLTSKKSTLLVYALRLDKLPNGLEMAKLSPQELYRQFVEQRKTGNLPPSNLTDPPQKSDGGRRGSLRGEDTWWKPAPLPRGSEWTPDP